RSCPSPPDRSSGGWPRCLPAPGQARHRSAPAQPHVQASQFASDKHLVRHTIYNTQRIGGGPLTAGRLCPPPLNQAASVPPSRLCLPCPAVEDATAVISR